MGTQLETTTDADGGYSFAGLPAGAFSVSASKVVSWPPDAGYLLAADGGVSSVTYTSTVPQLLSRPGSNGFFVDGAIYPASPMELPAGTQIAAGSVNGYAVSPDGRFIAFNNSTGLMLVTAAGGAPVSIGSAVAFAFSPDSRYLGFRTSGGTLSVVPVIGGNPVVVTTGLPSDPISSDLEAVFSPDGQYIAFISAGAAGALMVATVSSGTPAQVATNVSGYAFTGDSAHLLVTTKPDGNGIGTVFLDPLPPDGTSTTVGSGRSVIAGVSPDGKYVFLETSGTSGSSSFSLIPVSGGMPTVVQGMATPADFSPAGKYLVYWSGTNPFTNYVIPVTGGTPVQIGPAYPGNESPYVNFAPDDSHVSVQTRDGTLTVWSLPDGASQQIATNTRLGSVLFSPDGRFLMYLTDEGSPSAQLVPLPGGTPTTISKNPATLSFDFAFSPDGSRLLFLDNFSGTTGTLSVISTSGGMAVPLQNNVQDFILSADGSRVLTIASPTSDFWMENEFMASVVPATGGALIPLNSFVGNVAFISGGAMLLRSGTPSPFSFQDGLYLTPLP